MTASGDVTVNAGSVANSGTLYAQQNTTIGTAGGLTNSGTVAAQQNTMVNAASVASTGLLGAGINPDSTPGSSGNLMVTAGGAALRDRADRRPGYLPNHLRKAGMLSDDPSKFGPWFKG